MNHPTSEDLEAFCDVLLEDPASWDRIIDTHDGNGPGHLTVLRLVRALPLSSHLNVSSGELTDLIRPILKRRKDEAITAVGFGGPNRSARRKALTADD